MRPLVTPLVDNRAMIEEGLTRIVDSICEQNEQMSLRISELERAVHVERESLREEISRNRQEVSRSEKLLKKRTDEYVAKSFSRKMRETEERERRSRGDTRIDAMMERGTQAIMDRLDDLLGKKTGAAQGIEEHTCERLTNLGD